MAEEKDLKAEAKEKLSKVKGEIEHLEVQLALGKAEAAEQFDKKKQEFQNAVHFAKEEVDKLAEKGQKKLEELKPELEHLQVQLALGKAEGLDAYREYEKKVKEAVHGLTEKMKSLFENEAETGASEETSDGEAPAAPAGLVKEVKEKARDFQTYLDIFRVQLALGEAEAKQEYAEKKKEFVAEAQTIRGKIDKMLDEAEDTVEDLTEDAAEKFEEMKKKFLSWF